MKRILGLSVPVMATSLLAFGQTPIKKLEQENWAARKRHSAPTRNRYRGRFEGERAAPAVKSDTAYFDRLLADDYTNTNANGLVRSKAQVLSDFKMGALKYESLKVDDVSMEGFDRQGQALR